jgi:hypothetical protein
MRVTYCLQDMWKVGNFAVDLDFILNNHFGDTYFANVRIGASKWKKPSFAANREAAMLIKSNPTSPSFTPTQTREVARCCQGKRW